MEIICVPAIVTATYAIVELYKLIVKNKSGIWLKVIPAIALVIGGLLGVGIFFVVPQIIVADNVWVALIVGMCSGLSATGTNQIFKQLKKIGVEVKEAEKGENEEDKNGNV